MSESVSDIKLRITAGAGFVFTLIPIIFWTIWIHCFNSQNNQNDRVKMYESYFPEFLHGRFTISLVSLVVGALGILFTSLYWSDKNWFLKSISIIMLIVGAFVLILTLFSLM